MLQHFLKTRRILGLLLVAILVLVQAKIALAECVTNDVDVPMSISSMDDCQGCSNSAGAAKDAVSDYAFSKICGSLFLRSYVSAVQGSEIPVTAAVALINVIPVLPRVSPRIHAAFPGKVRLIYRLQRLLI